MRVISVGACGTHPLPVAADGGVLLDPETGTRAYFGDAARKALTGDSFPVDTSIIVPNDSSVSVQVEGDRFEMREAGAVHIGAGTRAQIDGVTGRPMVIQSDRAPSWYETHGPSTSTFDSIVEHTRPYPHAGYDATGLAFEKGSVVAYAAGGKRNVWTGQPSEWILNSTAWPGQSETVVVGVSRVNSSGEGVRDFHQVRPAESLHRHPERDGRRQVEAYLVTQGRAALAVERGGEVEYIVAGPGDMVVVEPGTTHCVAAIEGPYEHLAMQVPSTFQYGYLFKEEVGGDMHALMRGGVDALNNS